MAGAYLGPFGGFISNGAVAQMHICLQATHGRNRPPYWADEFQRDAQSASLPPPRSSSSRRPISPAATRSRSTSSVSSLDGDPRSRYARKVAAGARQQRRARPTSSVRRSADAPQVDVEFDRDRARALNVSIGTASTAVARGVRRRSRDPVHRRDGLKDVQVIYPQSSQTSLDERSSRSRSAPATAPIVHVGDFAHLVQIRRRR